MLLLIYIRKVPSRTIKRNLIKGHVETIGNLRTEGHGLMLNDPAQPTKTISEHTNAVKSSLNINPDINKFFLKIRPKPYISFD
jgi:hypothetical protein